MKLADRIAVISGGKISEIATGGEMLPKLAGYFNKSCGKLK
jgi:ABC-type proline/glycine betaine transport system ATPase subunit